MKVMFCCPAYRGIVCPPFLDSLEATVKLFTDEGITCTFEMIPGCSSIQMVRNEFARRFIESDNDVLFFLDDDISWTPQDALRLVRLNRPLAAGIYPMKTESALKNPFVTILYTDDEGKVLIDAEGCVTATRAPTGFMCIQRQVFDAIKTANPQLEYEDHPEELPQPRVCFDFFPQGVYERQWVGEDFAFCALWTALGGTITVLPDIDFGHHSSDRSWYGNLLHYIQALPGGIHHGQEGRKGFWTD